MKGSGYRSAIKFNLSKEDERHWPVDEQWEIEKLRMGSKDCWK